jgi:hypothetical protein
MSRKAKELVKGIVKNAAPKSTYATDPNDPWSAKAGIAENITSARADLLKRFYKAKGYNIDYVSKNQRVGQAKTGEFDKWKADHGIYEDEVTEETAPIAVKQIRSVTTDSPTHKRMHQLNKAAQLGTIGTVHTPSSTGLGEDNINDPQSACQSPFDGANTTDDVAPKKSKAGKMVKEIYAKHRLKEDLYDHEKDDKGPGTFGKAPKVSKKVEVNDDNEKGTNARMVLKGGTTLTGEKRDTIEIDPMLKNRSKTADYLDQDAKKQQLRTK